MENGSTRPPKDEANDVKPSAIFAAIERSAAAIAAVIAIGTVVSVTFNWMYLDKIGASNAFSLLSPRDYIVDFISVLPFSVVVSFVLYHTLDASRHIFFNKDGLVLRE